MFGAGLQLSRIFGTLRALQLMIASYEREFLKWNQSWIPREDNDSKYRKDGRLNRKSFVTKRTTRDACLNEPESSNSRNTEKYTKYLSSWKCRETIIAGRSKIGHAVSDWVTECSSDFRSSQKTSVSSREKRSWHVDEMRLLIAFGRRLFRRRRN